MTTLEPFEILRYHHEIFMGARYTVKISDVFENGCIPMYCGARMAIELIWRSFYK